MACKDVMGEMEEDVIEIPVNAAFASRQAKTFNKLRIGDELTDFTIISEGQTFPCHGVIIASSSDMFLAAFRTAMKESTKRQMELPDIPPNIVKIVLEYIYQNPIRVPTHLLLATVQAANYLHLDELKKECIQRACQLLKPSNVISWHKLAHKLDIKDLKESCSEVLSTSLPDVAESSEFQKLSLAELISYFSDMQDSDVDCDDKLEAVIKWIRHNQTSRREGIKPLVPYIDLSKCSVQCLDEAMKNNTDLLDKDMYKKFAESFSVISKQGNIRINRRGKKRMLVVIAGNKKTCWQVDQSMTLKVLCKDFQCSDWYSACEVPKGFVITGGRGSVLCMMYLISSQSWVPMKSMHTVRFAHASIYLQGKLYMFGGRVPIHKSKSVQSLELDAGKWVDEPDLPVAMEVPCVAHIDLQIFLLAWETNQLLCLDTKARKWNQMATCPRKAPFGTRMTSVNGQLLVSGLTTGMCALYTPATNSWVTCSPPTVDHHNGALICHNDRIYVIGGRYTETVEEYDLASDKWSVSNWKLPEKVENLQAVMVDDQ